MKNFLFITLSIIILNTSLVAQWDFQNSGVSTNLYTSYFLNPDTGWIAGANGVILKTSNGGSSWVQKPSGTSNSLSFIKFFNPNIGITAGAFGIIKMSSDGGESWLSISSGTSLTIQEGSFLNENLGWLVGNNGLVLKTTDGGDNWTQSFTGPFSNYWVQFISEDVGWICGANGEIKKTTNGGSTWELKAQVGGFSLWGVYFVTPDTGWVVGEFGSVFRSIDGGETWSSQSTGTSVNLRSIYFHDPLNGWVVGKDGHILWTTNGGEIWHTNILYPWLEYLNINFYNEQYGWIIGTSGVILYTDNGGLPIEPFIVEKTFGGVSSERGVAIEVTSDGGYIVGGSTSSFTSDQDMYLIKLDSTGTLEWSKVYHSNNFIDRLHDVKQTADGGYYLVGYIEGGFGFLDHSILKVDPQGNLIWAKNFGGIEADELRGISITTDGGALVSGYNASFGAGLKDIQAIKFFSDGSVDWAKNFGTIWEDHNLANIIATDGNFIFCGATDVSGNLDWRPTLVKADTLGNILWAKYYSGFNDDWSRDLIEAPDGGYFIVGETRSYGLGGSEDIYLIKTTINGDVEWAKAYGGISNESGRSIDLTSDNKIIIAGFTSSFGFGGYDAFLMKLNLDGTLVWFHTYGGYTDDYANSVKETADFGFALTGRRSTNTFGSDDVYLIKTDQDGNSSCEFGTFNANVFDISNLVAVDISMSTSSTISIADLNLTVLNPNTAENIWCGIIPVELKSFLYEIDGNKVLLKWSTATETNNMGFRINRDGEEIGFIPGAGTTTEPQNYSFADENVKNGTYLYSLIQIDYDGTTENVGEVEVDISNTPNEYSLQQNYPNPFNPSTIISFTVPERTKVVLKVYDVLGTEVAELINGIKSPGRYEVEFFAENLPSGIYFYTVQAGKFKDSKKMILLK